MADTLTRGCSGRKPFRGGTPCTDGYSLGAQGLAEDSFVKVNDDSLKLYGSGAIAQRVVVWQQENGCAVMGSWNLNTNQAYITARTMDVIRHERTGRYYDPDALFCFLHGGSATLSNYLFDDIRVDQPGWAAVQVYVQPNSFANPVGGVPGSISNVIFRNFSSSAAFLAPQPVQIKGYGAASAVTGVTFDAVTFAGTALSQAQIQINTTFATTPTLCWGCTASVVGATWTEAQMCGTPTSYCTAAPKVSSASGIKSIGVLVAACTFLMHTGTYVL